MKGMPVIPGRDRRGVALPRIPHTVNSSTRSPQKKDFKRKLVILQAAADVTRDVSNVRIMKKSVTFRRCRRGVADAKVYFGHTPHTPACCCWEKLTEQREP